MNSRRRAFSLIEILVVAALLAILTGIGLVLSGGGQRSSATTRAAAITLAEDLRSARRRAVSQALPVAVVFPSQGGAVALADGWYLLEGDTSPRIRRATRPTSDGSVGFFAGTWSTTEAVTRDMPAGGVRFSFDNWNAPQPDDFMLVFLPSGRVVSNGLVRHDGNFHVVATAGGDTQAASAPGNPGLSAPAEVFSLTRASSPNTVVISPAGSIQTVEGLPGATATVTLVSGRLSSTLATLPILSGPVSTPPVLTDVVVEPPGVGPLEALASGERTLNLIAEAQSPEGAVLFCQWTCAEGGAFGSSEAQRMAWDPVKRIYTSSWSWRPVGLAPATPFTLQCQVVDEFGNVATAASANLDTVTGMAGSPVDELVVKRTVGGKVGIWMVQSDLSAWRLVVDETSFTNFVDFDSAVISPGKERLILEVTASVTPSSPTRALLYSINFDGSGRSLLVGDLGSGSPRPYALSPDGTSVAAVTSSGVSMGSLNGPTTFVHP